MGYTTKNLAADTWYLIGCNFEQVGNTEQTIQDIVTGLVPGYDTTDAPMIEYWDGSELKILILMDSSAWSESAQDFITAWADPSDQVAVDIPATPGFGFWIKVPSAQTATFAGQVVGADDVTKDIEPAFNLMSSPYPISFGFNDAAMDCSNLTPGYDTVDSPMIEYWDGTELKILILMDSSAWSESAQDFITAWADPSDQVAVDIKNDVGAAFWVKSAAGATDQKIKFVK